MNNKVEEIIDNLIKLSKTKLINPVAFFSSVEFAINR